LKAFKIIRDPEAFPLLADETRRKIVYLLRAKEMTVSQIAQALNLTPQGIYHHIRKMKDADLVEVAREERVDHFIETYYRATAEVFHLAEGKGGPPGWAEGQTREALTALAQLGLRAPSDPETVTKIVELERRLVEVGEKEEWNDPIANLESIDFLTKQDLAHYAKLLTMSDEEFAEYLKILKELRKTLRSSLLEAPVAAVRKR
jgi:DNA-binding transcriptional ArsR family regulator